MLSAAKRNLDNLIAKLWDGRCFNDHPGISGRVPNKLATLSQALMTYAQVSGDDRYLLYARAALDDVQRYRVAGGRLDGAIYQYAPDAGRGDGRFFPFYAARCVPPLVLANRVFLVSSKFNVTPTHTVQEIMCLATMYPEAIECAVALWEDQIVAGVVLFHRFSTVHLQYSAANAVGYKLSALDLLLHHPIESGEQGNKKYFSFGVSNEQNGLVLNEGLQRYKAGFGSGGGVHEFYEVPLHAALDGRAASHA